MSRKLVTIRKVDKLVPIKGADFIELAIIDGWQCVVKKGEFKKGDKGVFFEIDSMLPLDERYSFLGKSTIDRTGIGYRLKTIKLRGVLSQGLMLPLSMFYMSTLMKEGQDVTEHLNVWLYEPKMKQGTVNSYSKSIGRWPPFLPKTDQERIQNKMHYFKTYKEDAWEATIKLDGSSITMWNYDKAPHILMNKRNKIWKNELSTLWQKLINIFKPPPTFGVCSRNINLQEVEGNAFWEVANKYNMRSRLKGYNVAVQAELIGPNIQSNHEDVIVNDMFIFDVYLIDEYRYMKSWERISFLDDIGILDKMVPVVEEEFSFSNGVDTFDKLQEYVTRDGMNPGVHAEGVVFKSVTGPNRSFKCISNKYLLKKKG